jgi:hypothetical protein
VARVRASRILNIGKYRPLLEARADMLRRAGYDAEVALTLDDALHMLGRRAFDLVLLCTSFNAVEQECMQETIAAKFPRCVIRGLSASSIATPILGVVASAIGKAESSEPQPLPEERRPPMPNSRRKYLNARPPR